MKIAYVGNFTQPHCTEVHISKTLQDLGHSVTEIQEDPSNSHTFIDQVKGHDLFLFTRTWNNLVTLEHLKLMKDMGIPTVSYHLDLYVGLQRESGLKRDPFWKTEFVFSPDGSEQASQVFKNYGINHFYMKPGVFKDECIMLKKNEDLSLGGDVIFVGGGLEYGHPEWPYRRELITFLMDKFPNEYRKFGHPQRVVRNMELNQLYANAKVVIGDSLCIGFNHPYYWSDRVYETMGRGGFMIHPYIKGMEEEFTDGKNIVFYEFNNWTQLEEKIRYYLTHEKEREKIRKAGFNLVKKKSTYHNRLKQMIDTVFSFPHLTSQEENDLTDRINNDFYLNPTYPEPSILKKVNLGAGTDIQPGWVNVDHLPLQGIDVVHNLGNYPWPFEDNSVSEMRAIDVLEHLPMYTKDDRPGIVAFIEECHRILKPGAEVFIQTPGWRSDFIWKDPTHVRPFDIESMDFFDPSTHFGSTTGFYSDCKFKVKKEELPNHNLRFWMQKI